MQLRKRQLSNTAGIHDAQIYANGISAFGKAECSSFSTIHKYVRNHHISITVIKISFLLVQNGVDCTGSSANGVNVCDAEENLEEGTITQAFCVFIVQIRFFWCATQAFCVVIVGIRFLMFFEVCLKSLNGTPVCDC